MIRDARVLREDFIPREVEHRDTEVQQLSTVLEPAVEGRGPDNSFIFGPTGAGKTCISRYVVEKLQEQALDVEFEYINCWKDYSRFKVLYRILEGINKTVDIHRRSTPKDELLERIDGYDESPYVVILDEVDQLEDTDVLYDLYLQPNIGMLMVGNREEELFAEMDERVVSRLKPSMTIRFDRYTVNELASILRDRVDWGLERNAVPEPQLERIADLAAGDARVAIGILRAAARKAETEGVEQLDDQIIEEAVPEARSEIRDKNLDKMNDDQSVLYEIIKGEGTVAPGTLYDRYRENVEDPVTKRTVRNYLKKMCRYDIIESQGSNRGRKYTVE
ncbi:MAG: Cdc6/Cdc18 family protein [Halobacteria archaeon]